MQALTPCELFESGTRGAWNKELYRLPSADSPEFHRVEKRYHLHNENEDIINGYVDPRVIFSTVGEGVGPSGEEEEEEECIHAPSGIKRSAGGCDENDHYLCLPCNVRKHHACTCDSDDISTPSLRPSAVTKTEWRNHNTPLLQEYAERQISPPLIDRVNIELNHPTQFVKGTLQMLSNRNKDSGEPVHPTHQLEPQLLDGFVDIHKLANEYLRSQFSQELVGDLVPVLLTIITNNFYEAHMRLMDDIVRQALANKDARMGPCLEVKDFAFGFDLHMSQDIPFFVDVNHRVRDTLESLQPKPPATVQPRAPQTTRYGRTTKPTQQMAELEVKKTGRTRTTTIKKGERTEISTHVVEPTGGTMTPATEPAGGSTISRPRKPLPARARVTSKPKNPKQPDASTSSNVGRRPRQTAAARAKVTKNPPEHPQVSTSFDVLPSIVSPMTDNTETSHSSTYFTAHRSQGRDTEADPKTQVSSSGVTAVALDASQALAAIAVGDAEHRMSMASTNDRKKVEGPMASTSTAIHSHVSELTTQLLPSSSSIPDAQLFEFITWATDKAETETLVANRQVHQEVSQPQYSEPLLDDYNTANDMRPEMNAPLTTEAVEDPQEPKMTPSPTRAAEVQLSSQDTPSRCTVKDTDNHDTSLLRVSPLTPLLNSVKLFEITIRGESSQSSNTSLTTSIVSMPAEGVSENSSLAPTPASLEEDQTPDTSTMVGYDSDATDATVSTLATSHVPPMIKFQKIMSARRTARSETAESADDQSSQLTIKLPAQSLPRDDTPPTAESVAPTQSRLPVSSKSQPTRRSLRTRNLAEQIPAGSSSPSRSRPLGGITVESTSHRLSPLSTEGAVPFLPEHEPRVSKKRKLGQAT